MRLPIELCPVVRGVLDSTLPDARLTRTSAGLLSVPPLITQRTRERTVCEIRRSTNPF